MTAHELRAGFLYIASSLALVAAPLDDKARAFEDAVNAAPQAKVEPAANPRFQSRSPNVAELRLMLQRGDPDASIEMVATQLMAAHPAALVQQTGTDFIGALEERRHRKDEEFATKANAALADARTAITNAKTPADLDQVLAELSGIAGPQMQMYAFDAEAQALAGQLNLAQQFISAWQDYLSASSAGRTEQAREDLERLLNNTQLGSLNYFPARSSSPFATAPPVLSRPRKIPRKAPPTRQTTSSARSRRSMMSAPRSTSSPSSPINR